MTDRIYAYRDAIPSIDIFEPSLPQPWIHYLSNGELHAFVSQAGGGFAWWKDAIARRLSRYRMHHLPADRPGFYLYIAEEGIVGDPCHTCRECDASDPRSDDRTVSYACYAVRDPVFSLSCVAGDEFFALLGQKGGADALEIRLRGRNLPFF